MAIDFTLSPEELGLRAQAHEFAEKVLSGVPEAIAPLADPLDRFRALQPFYQQMVDAGFVKGLVPAENGGGRFTNLQFALACEELARVDVNVASAVLGTGLGLYPIVVGGTPEQKERFSPRSSTAARRWARSRSARPRAPPTSTPPTRASACRPSPCGTATASSSTVARPTPPTPRAGTTAAPT